MKHKNCDVIVAWASGIPIQYRVVLNNGVRSPWVDIFEFPFDKTSPNFDAENCEWRIKPKKLAIKYRLALMQNGNSEYYIVLINENSRIEKFEDFANFEKWISDWIEYKIDL
jgi:hypothetical protein